MITRRRIMAWFGLASVPAAAEPAKPELTAEAILDHYERRFGGPVCVQVFHAPVRGQGFEPWERMTSKTVHGTGLILDKTIEI